MTAEEWQAGIQFLTEAGAQSNKVGNEFILLSDVFGVSALVDTMNNPPLKNATESCLEGPAFTPDAPDSMLFRLMTMPVYLLLTESFPIFFFPVPNGGSIIDDKDGIGESEYLYVEGQVTNTDGKPLQNVVVETWETDDEGLLLILTISHFF